MTFAEKREAYFAWNANPIMEDGKVLDELLAMPQDEFDKYILDCKKLGIIEDQY